MTINPKELADEIRQLAADHPNKEAACVYVDEVGDPVCIVGHAASNLGVLDVLLRNNEEIYGPDSLGLPIGRLIEGDRDTVSWITDVQEEQDNGATWGEAVLRADRMHG